jgi:hypothetical protein
VDQISRLELRDLLRAMAAAGPGVKEIAARWNKPYGTLESELSRVGELPQEGETLRNKLGLVDALALLDEPDIDARPFLDWLDRRHGYLPPIREPRVALAEGETARGAYLAALGEIGRIAERLKAAEADGVIDQAECADLRGRAVIVAAHMAAFGALLENEAPARNVVPLPTRDKGA